MEKVKSICDLLKKDFPASKILDKEDFDLHAHSFKILENDTTYLLKVGGDFIEDHSSDEIKALFAKWNVIEELKNCRKFYVLVTNEGTQKQPRT